MGYRRGPEEAGRTPELCWSSNLLQSGERSHWIWVWTAATHKSLIAVLSASNEWCSFPTIDWIPISNSAYRNIPGCLFRLKWLRPYLDWLMKERVSQLRTCSLSLPSVGSQVSQLWYSEPLKLPGKLARDVLPQRKFPSQSFPARDVFSSSLRLLFEFSMRSGHYIHTIAQSINVLDRRFNA